MNIFRRIGRWFRPDKPIRLRTSEYTGNNIDIVECIFVIGQKGKPAEVVSWGVELPKYEEGEGS